MFLSRLIFGLFVVTTVANAAELEPSGSAQHIQVLAVSCAACHGQNGNSAGVTPVIAGLSSDYFVSQMLAFKTGQVASTVMHHHAKGLTDIEIQQLADYFSQQKRITSKLPPHD